MSCSQTSDLIPALALDALEVPEREALEAHLRRCPDCAREVSELREVAAQLALAQPQHEPPAALGRRILAIARSEPEPEQPRTLEPVPPSSTPRVSASPRLRVPASLRLALASIVAALAAILWGLSLQAQLSETQRQLADNTAQLERIRGNYGTVVRVLGSTETQVRELRADDAAPGAQGTLWIDLASGQGMLMARNLPPISADQTYQVWLTNADTRVSAGFLRAYDEGVYYLVLQAPGSLSDYQRLGITREPFGGSSGPTGPRVVVGEI
jgi:anti-sigma-K factor RskA